MRAIVLDDAFQQVIFAVKMPAQRATCNIRLICDIIECGRGNSRTSKDALGRFEDRFACVVRRNFFENATLNQHVAQFFFAAREVIVEGRA